MTNQTNLTHQAPFAFIEKDGIVTYYEGEKHELDSLDELQDLSDRTKRKIVFAIPFNQIRERGSEYMARGDEKIIAIDVHREITQTRDKIKSALGGTDFELDGDPVPSVSDEDFSESVTRIQEEIAKGKICQTIISRRFEGRIKNLSPEVLREIYKRFLDQRGQYMTIFMRDSDEHALISASPERHLEITDGKVIMNPIAGTLPKGDIGTFEERFFAFLEDKKEIDELYQVLDEELKMMAVICPKGGRIEGPFVRETGAVIHTEYKLVGERCKESSYCPFPVEFPDSPYESPVHSLRHTLHAPTLVGGPMASASRQIYKHETESRRYYGGEIGLLSPDGNLDSAIMIRGAEIFGDGKFAVQAGAGIVKNSVPEKETEETTMKAAGALKMIMGQTKITDGYVDTIDAQEVEKRLKRRNEHLSRFHFESQSEIGEIEELRGKTVTIVNNEDNFAYMIGHMAAHMGCTVKVVDTFEFDPKKDDSDIVILGPGPGDINDTENKRMRKLLGHAEYLKINEKSVLGICLGHQALARVNGMEVVRQQTPTQGLQREVDFFGKKERLGFYNSFTASGEPKDVKLSRDESGSVVALRKEKMSGFQFHPESVMSENGYNILSAELKRLLS